MPVSKNRSPIWLPLGGGVSPRHIGFPAPYFKYGAVNAFAEKLAVLKVDTEFGYIQLVRARNLPRHVGVLNPDALKRHGLYAEG